MKLAIPAIAITALIAASPAAVAQYNWGNASTPGASVLKDDATFGTTRSERYTASHTRRYHHHAKHHMGSKPETTGSGSSSGER